MLKKKLTAITIILFIGANSILAGAYSPNVEKHWSNMYIDWVNINIPSANSYIEGFSNPDNPIKTGEFLFLLDKVLNIQGLRGEYVEIVDESIGISLDNKHWAYENIISLIDYINRNHTGKYNFFDIFPGPKINLNEPILRSKVALLARSVTSPSILREESYYYRDLPLNTEIHNDIMDLIGNHIMKGYEDNTFRLGRELTIGEAAVIIKRIYDDLEFLKNNLLNFNPIGSVNREKFPLFKIIEAVENSTIEDVKFRNAIISLEYLSFIGYIPFEEEHLYDLDPVATLWSLKEENYYNIIGINYYLIGWDKSLDLDQRKQLIKEGFEHYSSLTNRHIEDVNNFFEISKQYYSDKELLVFMESLYKSMENSNKKVDIALMLAELYVNINKLDKALIIYKQLVDKSIDIDKKMGIIGNYTYLLFEMKGQDYAMENIWGLWENIRKSNQYSLYNKEIDWFFTSIIKQIKIKTE